MLFQTWLIRPVLILKNYGTRESKTLIKWSFFGGGEIIFEDSNTYNTKKYHW